MENFFVLSELAGVGGRDKPRVAEMKVKLHDPFIYSSG